MPRLRQIQQRWTQGEIDPKLIGRNDIDQYYGAAEKMQNLFPISQGGVTRRPGTEYIDSVASGAVKMIEFRYSETDTYLLVVTSGQFKVYKDGVYKATVSLSAFNSSTKVQYMTWTQGGDTLLLFHEDVPTQKVVRNSDTSWTVSAVTWDFTPLYAFTLTKTNPNQDLNPNADYGDTESLRNSTPWVGECYAVVSSSLFTSAHLNQYIEAAGGYGRIMKINSSTKVKLYMEIAFPHWKIVESGDWTLLTGFESAWSATRGYPRCGSFHNGRLYIGGSKSLPTTIWASKVGEYWNFDKGAIYDSDGIERTLDVGTNDKTVSLYSGRSLFAMTTGGCITIAGSVQGPITPLNFNSEKQNSIGIKYGTSILEHEGSLIYTQSEGASIQELIYDDAQNGFTSGALSWLSSHLINNPVAVALRKSTSTDQGTYMLIVNADGSMTVANILRSQGIASFVPVVMSGASAVSCGVDGTDVYWVVDRGADRCLLKMNFDITLDGATIYSEFPASSAGSLSRFNGMEVVAIVDGVVYTGTVADDTLDLETEAEESLVVGMDYEVILKDLPVDEKQLGSVIGQKKNVSEVILQLYETQNVAVKGKEVPITSADDTPNPEFTGTKKMSAFRGWDTTGQVEITQSAPLKMTILAMTKKVNV